MKYCDFSIGLEFMSLGGLRYRCTDIGTRTILAISLDVDNPKLLQGPPYMQNEKVFDEVAMAQCFLTHQDAILKASLASKSNHPGFSTKAMRIMMDKSDDYFRYPHKNLLRQDRVYDNDVAHPYSVYQDEHGWKINCYLILKDEPIVIAESDFLELDIATNEDFPAKKPRTSEA